MKSKYSRKIIRITGGIGNQLFQYSFIYCLSKVQGKDFLLDTSSYLSEKIKGNIVHNGYELKRVFGIDKKANLFDLINSGGILKYYIPLFFSKLLKKKFISHIPVCVEDDNNYFSYNIDYLDPKFTYYHGFFQSHKYIDHFRKDLIDIFTFPNISDKNFDRYSKEIKLSETSVSMHVRLGDYGYYSDNNKSDFHTYNLDYYRKAIEYIKERTINPRFFVFSDDIGWCKKNFESQDDLVFVENERGNKDYYDMKLMSSCKHHIIANSSFSWWGAWLGDSEGVVVCPKIWHRKYPNSHPCPNSWTRL